MELLDKNIGKIGLSGRGDAVRKTVASTNDGTGIALYSTDPILITSWRIDNPDDGETINYKVLASKEHQPAADDDSWDELVASTELAADAVATEPDDDGQDTHHTAIMVVITSAAAGVHSTDVRVVLAGSV